SIDLSFIDSQFFTRQFFMLVRVWLAILPVIAFGLFIAIWTGNTAISLTLGSMTYLLTWIALMIYSGAIIMLVVLPRAESGQAPNEIDLGIWGYLLSLSPQYNMDVVAHWGNLSKIGTDAGLSALAELDLDLPLQPWRGVAMLFTYSLISVGLARWVFWRKDVMI
ncbi:MAG: hypothetical protein JXA42_03505, partial [Anaerolineales bacterium]|nr:hypothetical protein [Anaerolineales bacterium]